ncbi:MAG: hypothetical protein Q9227_005424 [Pyrenula ochraceoflavens]
MGHSSNESDEAPKPRVKLSKSRFRNELLPSNATCSYTRVIVDGILVGHAFACRWKYRDIDEEDHRSDHNVDNDNDSIEAEKTVCWVTQLVVRRNYRRRGLATGLLRILRENGENDAAYGIASSHPAACMAAARAFGDGIESIDPNFIRLNSSLILRASPIRYIKTARLHGSLFTTTTNGFNTTGTESRTDLVSSAHTDFFVDHTEPLQVLEDLQGQGRHWPLGELLDGHEFLLIIQQAGRYRA